MGRNAERLRELYDRFGNDGDWRAGADIMARDIEWNGLEDAGLGGRRIGHREVSAFFREWLDAWDVWSNPYDIVEVTDDVIVVETHFKGRGKASGLELEVELGQVWEFEDGLAVRQTMYRSYEEAHRVAQALK
jgi:ketosteroid isomerase-like protein